jgi:hypothetical protein
MQPGLVSLEVQSHQLLESLVVRWPMEDRLAMIAAQDRVIEAAWDVDAGTTGHAAKSSSDRSGSERGAASGPMSPAQFDRFDGKRCAIGAGVTVSGCARRNRNRNTGTSRQLTEIKAQSTPSA